MKLRKWACALLAAVVASQAGIAAVQAAPATAPAEKAGRQDPALGKAQHAKAVELAREKRFDLALPMLEQLCAEYPANREMAYDYWVVLTWDGQNEKAVRLFEKRAYAISTLPDYVRMAMGGAYFSTGNYTVARRLFAAVPDSLSARIAEAQSAILGGTRDDGEKIFEGLIAAGRELEVVYRERAVARELIGAYKEAASDRQKLLELMPDTPENLSLRKQTTADALRDLIRGGAFAPAAEFGRKQIAFMTGDRYFESDYIVALQVNENFAEAVREAERLWGDQTRVPSYGLQSLAECYMELGKWKQATHTYERIVSSGDTGEAIQAGQAIAYAQGGRMDLARQLYEKLAAGKNPETIDLLVSNILILIDFKRPFAAQQLTKALTAALPAAAQVKPLVQVGERFYETEYAREAYEHFRQAHRIKPDDPGALVGMGRAAIVAGDYEVAKKTIETLKELRIRTPETIRLNSEFAEREKGNLESGFYHTHTHLQETADDFVARGEQRISHSHMILAQWRRLRIANNAAGDSALMYSASAGIGRVWVNDSIRLWAENNWTGGRSRPGFRVSYVRNFGTNTSWDFGVARHPYEDASALRQNPFIMMTDYSLGFTRILGPSRIRLAYTWGLLSDSNTMNGLTAEWQRTWHDDDKTAFTTSLFATRTAFRAQEINGTPVVYDSPVRREGFGVSAAKRWKYKTHYWELSPTVKWERDWPDKFQLGPSVRLEYGKEFSRRHSLVLGVEYGVFWPQEGGGMKYGAFQYDASYRASW